MQDFDVVGDGDEVGAILARASGRPTAAAPRRAASPQLTVARPGWMAPSGVPQGVTLPQEELDFLPFEMVTFTSTSNSGRLVAFPQRPFRGERIIFGAVLQLAAGAVSDARDGVVINPAIFVGATQVGATQGATPLSVFSPNAFGVRLSFPPAGQGTRIAIPIESLITLAVGDTIKVTCSIIGRAVRLLMPRGNSAMRKLLPVGIVAMRIRLAIPDDIIDGPIIDAALEATTRANEALAARGLLPDLGQALHDGVRWRPEPWLGERFDLAPDVVDRGWGDCDDLGPWLAAQLRAAGEQARAFAHPTSKSRWHVQVERGDGTILDPSKWAGMPTSSKGKHIAPKGMAAPSIAGPGESLLCALPWEGKWHVRADHPLTERLHVSGMARGADLDAALARAVGTYAAIAEGVHGIGDATVSFGLADIITATAPAAAAAQGQPCGALSIQLGPMGSGLADAASELDDQAADVVGGDGAARAKPERVPGAPPPGWPAWARTYAIAGPGGHGAARLVRTPGGGPLLVKF